MSFSRPRDGPSKQEFQTEDHEDTRRPSVPQRSSALGFTVFRCSKALVVNSSFRRLSKSIFILSKSSK